MEDVYDLYKHTHCVVIWIKKRDVYIEIYPNICRSRFVSEVEESHSKDDLIHDSKIEDPSPNKSSSENGIPIDSFMEALHRLFEKGKDNWDEDDKPLMRAASDFLSRKVKKSIQELENSIETLNALHYAFVVPYKWNENIREEIIRPIFIQSGLISSEDHQDRLLFFTDIESICYSLQNTSTTINPLKRGQNSIFCRFSSAKKNEALIKLDLIQTTNNLFNFSGSLLFPKVMNSSSLSISEDYIKSSLKEFLSERIFPRQEDANKKRRSMRKFLKDELLPEYEDHIIIEAMAEDIYSGKLPDLVIVIS